MVFLKTTNLILRNFEPKDLNELFNYRNDLNCSKYQRWENSSLEYLENMIEENMNLKILDKKTLQLAIALSMTNEIIGHIYTNEIIGHIYIYFKNKTITLGYTIAPKYQRKGYAYEMIKSLINYIFSEFPKHEIVCLVHPDNQPSINLLEKLNFKNEGYKESINSIIYSLIEI